MQVLDRTLDVRFIENTDMKRLMNNDALCRLSLESFIITNILDRH